MTGATTYKEEHKKYTEKSLNCHVKNYRKLTSAWTNADIEHCSAWQETLIQTLEYTIGTKNKCHSKIT